MNISRLQFLYTKVIETPLFFNLFSVVIISTALFAAYSNSFYSPFYFDDYGYVIGEKSIEISSLSFESIRKAAITPGKSRAVANITFALNHYLHGDKVFGFHLFNFLIHLGSAVTAFFLFKVTLTLDSVKVDAVAAQWVAFSSALLWALNPLHTNSVTYIIQRMNSLAGLFFLLSTLLYVYGRKNCTSNVCRLCLFALSVFAGILAIFSKENAFMLPAMIGAYELFFLSELKTKRDFKKAIVFILFAGAFLGIVVFSLRNGERLLSSSGYANKDFTMLQRLLTEPRVIFFYLSLLLVPLPSRLNLLHDFSLSTSIISPPQTLAAIIAIVALFASIIWTYRKYRLISFALFWFLGNLLIESSFLPLALIFEHRTYIPSVFLFMALIALSQQFITKKYVLQSCLTIIIILLAVFTWQRNQVWTNSLLFWSDIAQKSPNISRGHLGRYFALKRRGDDNNAHLALLEAVKVDPGDSHPMTNLVNTYMEQQKFSKAISVLNRYLKYEQTASAYIDRAKAHAMLQQFRKAASDAEKAVKLQPNSGLAWLIRGKSLSSLNQQRAALEALNRAKKLGFKSAMLDETLGEVYLNSGNTDLAIHYFKESLKTDPDSASAHYYLGLAYGKKGMRAEAKKEMEIGLYLKDNPKRRSKNPHNF